MVNRVSPPPTIRTGLGGGEGNPLHHIYTVSGIPVQPTTPPLGTREGGMSWDPAHRKCPSACAPRGLPRRTRSPAPGPTAPWLPLHPPSAAYPRTRSQRSQGITPSPLPLRTSRKQPGKKSQLQEKMISGITGALFIQKYVFFDFCFGPCSTPGWSLGPLGDVLKKKCFKMP